MIDPGVFAAFDLWKQCPAGPLGGRLLPCAGGVGDQPAALMDAFTIIDGLIAGKGS